MNGVSHLYAEKEEIGLARVQRFTVNKDYAKFFNIRNYGRDAIKEGDYVKLYVGNELMMSDTPMERTTNSEFVRKANGRVLIAGLGVGLIVNAILEKTEVTEVIVVEKYDDVISIVAPKFNNNTLKIIHSDIFDYKPLKSEKFDTIYFDIWPDICTDNLEQIKLLHNRFKNKLNKDNPNRFMNSWVKERLQYERKQERKQRNYWY